jgi:hypothetical protein
MAEASGGRFGPVFWGAAFGLAIMALAGLRIYGIIGQATGFFILLACSAMIVPMIRSANRLSRERGCASPALIRYNKGMGSASIAYIFGLGVAVWLFDKHAEPTTWTYLLALAPVLPIFGMIWVMGRYIVEETDEYLRHRAVMAAMIGLGGVLAIGSAWGFLESFRLAPHVPGWASVPVWAISMGIGQLWLRGRER